MTYIPGGRFVMGSDRYYREEGPAHEKYVDPFWIDTTPVTNRDFATFVQATGYVTLAERPFEVAPGDTRAPGSLVFTPTDGPVDLRDWRKWWTWTPGAHWRDPRGTGVGIDTLLDHPVVHIALEDANTYARWSGKRLPTEAEHEYASGAGVGTAFSWGDEPLKDGTLMANWWQGRFPYENLGEHSTTGTSPVGAFPGNTFGLVDMIGNVWEWTADAFRPHQEQQTDHQGLPMYPRDVPQVVKGGSFLCSPHYCLRFRPSARSAQTPDSATSHIGFRCALTPETTSK